TGAVTVHGRVVEVRTELVDGILRVRAHEDLAPETDDRLFWRAVTVVGVSLAVELDQSLVVLFGPEDVVREKAVTVIRGLFCDLRRSDRPVPDEGSDAVQ